jgi:hypothetical protein
VPAWAALVGGRVGCSVSGPTEAIQDVLEKHRFHYSVTTARHECTCGQWCDSGPGSQRVRHNYEEHLADVVVGVLTANGPSPLEALARYLMGSGRVLTWSENEDGTGTLYVPDDLPDPVEIVRMPRPVPFAAASPTQQPHVYCERCDGPWPGPRSSERCPNCGCLGVAAVSPTQKEHG